MPDLVGQTIGKYRIVARLGRGGMAEVYKGYQASLDRYVAIKVLYSDLAGEAASIARFHREAKAVAALRHPNIVQVFDFDVQDDMYYMAMEFVNGPTLKRELEERSLQGRLFTLDETVRIMVALCQAIDYAHSRGMVHRDLKPANFILTNDGQILVLDFGIAKMVNTTKFTATGSVMGTPTYMSPEQGQGERGDERSDIYSLGVVLYHMATGKLPFDADTPFAVILKHISAPLPMPSTVNPDIPDSLERVILKALSKDPADRFQTGVEFADALGEAAGIAANDSLTKNPVGTIALPPEVAHALAQSEPAVESAPATGSTQAMIPCPVCGADTLAGSKFCTSCGVSITTFNAPTPPATQTIPPPQQSNLLLLGLGMGGVAAVLLALVVVIGGLIYFTTRNTDAPAPQAAAQIVPSHTPTHTPAPTPTDTPQPATATPTPSPSPTAQTVSSDALPTATPTPTFTPTNTPTPAPTPTPTPLGQNCNREAGGTFNSLWQSYRHIIGCPLAPQQTLSFMAEEIFQGGHMFWREDLDEVYVVFDRQANGTDLFQGSWQTNPAWKWDGSFPNGTGASPPSGLVEPIRGFGWVWRNQMNGANGPLGWALDGEHGFDNLGQVQMFEQGLMFKGSAPKVYLLLYDGRFFAQ